MESSNGFSIAHGLHWYDAQIYMDKYNRFKYYIGINSRWYFFFRHQKKPNRRIFNFIVPVSNALTIYAIKNVW